MVRKILGFLYKETKSLNQAAFLLGLFSFLSQILGLLRDRLLAHIFGAGQALDIYTAAFRIPDFIFVTAASIVSLSVLIPFIINEESKGKESLRRFVDNIFSFFAIFIVAISVLAFFLMPFAAKILFKGFNPSELAETIFLSRVLLLSPIILGLSNLLGSITQAYGRFTVYALAPVLYNAGIVLGVLVFATKLGVLGVALGVIIGALFHVFIQVPSVMSLGLFPRLRFIDWKMIKNVVTISLPRTLTLSMSQLSAIFLISLASLMSAGSISVLYFSINLMTAPLSLIGVSYSLAAFPTLSRNFKERNFEAFKNQMRATARFIIFWSLPLTALIVILRAQIVRVLLGSGQFGWEDTRLVAAALALFIISSLSQSLLLLFMRGFYSAGFTRKPFFINLVSTIVLFFLAWSSVKLFYASEFIRHWTATVLRVQNLPDTAVLVLPLAFSLATILNSVILWAAFEREFPGFSRGIARTLFDSLGASFIIGVVAYLALKIFGPLFNTATLPGIFAQGFLSGITALVAGVAVLLALKNKELSEIWDAVRQKFVKTRVIATDPEIV
ncbi:MAG: hypothetical protein HYS51_00125 [Candidatus Zambryskibacteria bacterium]|nr:hypothetical protein [Candidatus Zambryskibacteria bacterium]